MATTKRRKKLSKSSRRSTAGDEIPKWARASAISADLNSVEQEILRRIEAGELIETNLSTLPGSGNREQESWSSSIAYSEDRAKVEELAKATEPRRVWTTAQDNSHPSKFDQVADRVIKAFEEMNAALQEAYKIKEMRVAVSIPRNAKEQWRLPLQIYPRVFRMVRSSFVVKVQMPEDVSKEEEITAVEGA